MVTTLLNIPNSRWSPPDQALRLTTQMTLIMNMDHCKLYRFINSNCQGTAPATVWQSSIAQNQCQPLIYELLTSVNHESFIVYLRMKWKPCWPCLDALGYWLGWQIFLLCSRLRSMLRWLKWLSSPPIFYPCTNMVSYFILVRARGWRSNAGITFGDEVGELCV